MTAPVAPPGPVPTVCPVSQPAVSRAPVGAGDRALAVLRSGAAPPDVRAALLRLRCGLGPGDERPTRAEMQLALLAGPGLTERHLAAAARVGVYDPGVVTAVLDHPACTLAVVAELAFAVAEAPPRHGAAAALAARSVAGQVALLLAARWPGRRASLADVVGSVLAAGPAAVEILVALAPGFCGDGAQLAAAAVGLSSGAAVVGPAAG